MREKRGSVPPAARYAVDAASSRGGSTLSLANTMQRRPQFPASMTGSASGNLTPYLSAQQSRESFRSQRSQGIPVSERRGPSASRTPSSVRQPTLLRPHSTATSIPEMIVESMADRPSQEDEQHDYAHYWDFAYQQGSPALEHPEPAAVPTLEYPLGNDEAEFSTHEQTITPYSDSEMRLEPKTSTPSLRKPKPVVLQEGRAMHHTYQGPVYEKPKTLQTYPTPEVSDVSNNGLPPRTTSRSSWRQSLRRSWSLGSFDFENRSDMTSSTFPSFSQLRLPGIDYEHDNYDQRGISTLSWIASESSGDHELEEGNYAWPWRGEDPENPIPSSRHDSGIMDKEKGPLPDTEREMRLSTIIPDPNIVGWDSEKDPENPMNWSMKRKKISIIALALFTFITPLASSMFAPAVPQLLVEFDISSRLLSQFVVSVYVLGFAVGPLIVSPMSEVYGRYPVYIVGYIGFIAFTIGCALATSMPMLIVFRFFAGCFGVTPVAIGGGTIADLFPKEQRGKFMGLWALGPMLGPMVGPIGGGYLAAALNWRWVFWVITMASGLLFVISTTFTTETFAPVLLARKTARLRALTRNPALRSALSTSLPPSTIFLRALQRPTHFFFRSPIVASMSIYVSLVYGILYVLFTTFTFVFVENYGWSPQKSGLVYIGLGIGTLLGLLILGSTSDRLCQHLANKKNSGVLKPEYRLPPLVYGGVCVPMGLFLYGWATQYTLYWPVPLAGTVLVGLGIIQTFMCIQTYLVDTFGMHAASAIAVNTVLRSVVAAFLPMAGLSMYDALGLGWGNSLLGFVALALVPIPGLFWVYGERLRTSERFQVRL